MTYLDAVALARLKSLRLDLSRLTSEGRASGRHRSLWRGASREFASHRAYVPGDEVKALDWKAYARRDRFYVREHDSESLLDAYVLVDASGSMAFQGAGPAPKWESACRLAMAAAYLAAAGGDAAGLGVFDTELRVLVPPRASLAQLERLDSELSRRRPVGETDLSRVLQAVAPMIKRRSLVVLISDLLGEPEKIVGVLKAFKARRHELLILQVLDPSERDLDFEGAVVFESLEDGALLPCSVAELRRSYRREFERTLKLYEANFHRAEIAYAPFYTDVAWDVSLGRFLSRLS